MVLGHAIELVWGGKPLLRAVWQWIYVFHMPLFVFICGYYTRGQLNGERLLTLACRLIAPYFIFLFLYRLFFFYMQGKTRLELDLFHSYDLLWFLPALFFWRLLQPILIRCRFPLLLALVLGLLISFNPFISGVMGLNQTFSFLPYFTLGLLAQQRNLQFLHATPIRIVSALVLVAGFFLLYHVGSEFDTKWLRYTMYKDVGHREWNAFVYRLAVYAAALLSGTAFLSLMPQRESRLSRLGRYTLYPYLLHYFVIKGLALSGLLKGLPSGLPAGVWLAILLALSAGIVWITASRPSRRLFGPLIQVNPYLVRRYLVFAVIAGYAFCVHVNWN